MEFYVFGRYCRLRVLFVSFLAMVFFMVTMKIALKSNWLVIRNNSFLSTNYELNNCYYVVKPFFNFICDKNRSNSSRFSILSEKHICDQLYLSNAEPSLFSRLKIEFQQFSKQKILLTDIENISNSCSSCHHVQIIRSKLYNVPRSKAWNYETRSQSVKMLIKHVVDTFPDIPDLDLFFNVQDIVDLPDGLNNVLFNVPIFAMTKSNKVKRGLRADSIILMPCFTFWSWPEARAGRWPDKLQSILSEGQKLEFNKRVPKLFWRGVSNSWKRKWFAEMAQKYSDIIDVSVMEWARVQDTLALSPSNTYKTLEQHCSYKYLLHQEGASYSSRVKYLLLCGSTVVFNVIEYWEEYWYHLLENDKNIILFEGNNNETSINNTLYSLKHQEEKAKDVGAQGRQMVQNYLNEHAVSCYWWKILHEYAKLLGYKPSLHPNAINIEDSILGRSI